jgi:putative ribosome biogenesis GTPase RsgA
VQLDFIESLDSLGYCVSFSQPFQQLARPDLAPARVVSHVGSRLIVAGAPSARAELSGRLRHQLSPVDQPTVGDWVALAPGPPDGIAIIHHVLPRRTLLVRRAAGKRVEPQAVAANVDVFLVVTSANGDANARRIERYLAAIEDGGGLAGGFDEVLDAAAACRFRDCRHAGEPGCAVTAAIDDGSLAEDRVRAYHKLEREVAAAELRTNPVTRLREKQRIRARTMALRARGKVDPKLGR